MNLERRSFLRTGLAAGVALYTEPLLATPHNPQGQWIEDRGDHVIVRVPAGKTFSREEFNVPVIFLMGDRAAIREVKVRAFANLLAYGRAAVEYSEFDDTMMRTERPREMLSLQGTGIWVTGCSFIGTRRDWCDWPTPNLRIFPDRVD